MFAHSETDSLDYISYIYTCEKEWRIVPTYSKNEFCYKGPMVVKTYLFYQSALYKASLGL
jgi:hypothetical protein